MNKADRLRRTRAAMLPDVVAALRECESAARWLMDSPDLADTDKWDALDPMTRRRLERMACACGIARGVLGKAEPVTEFRAAYSLPAARGQGDGR